MASAVLRASAEPEKRLFIELLTRDISLIDAVLDLIDNSINSAIISAGEKLSKPGDYLKLLQKTPGKANTPQVDITLSTSEFSIVDTCGGIPVDKAETEVFRFGKKETGKSGSKNRLSVYGIGLKRAIFKIGNDINIQSAHRDGGFLMHLNVHKWEQTPQQEWSIPMRASSQKVEGHFGTSILIKSLYPDIAKRIGDRTLIKQLQDRIAKTYCYFLERIVRIVVNGRTIEPAQIEIGENSASQTFNVGAVACAVVAGIGVPRNNKHVAENAGWYVFCNGRAVAFAEKTTATGWGIVLPSFQPKHRPFVGLVFFTSADPEALPWTTTKSSINQESGVWQHTLGVMGVVGRQITKFLDSRYNDDGTEITAAELSSIAGPASSALRSVAAREQVFRVVRTKKDITSIQYSVRYRR
jgi:hypothetical protein